MPQLKKCTQTMNYYDDNPEGLEPEDYIEDYGEAGRSAWDESSQYKSSAKRRNNRHNAQPNNDDAYWVLGLVAFVCILFFILMMIIF